MEDWNSTLNSIQGFKKSYRYVKLTKFPHSGGILSLNPLPHRVLQKHQPSDRKCFVRTKNLNHPDELHWKLRADGNHLLDVMGKEGHVYITGTYQNLIRVQFLHSKTSCNANQCSESVKCQHTVLEGGSMNQRPVLEGVLKENCCPNTCQRPRFPSL